MPMVKGKAAKSRKGFSKNVQTEMHAGKPQKAAVAIAYSEARKGKKAAKKGKKSYRVIEIDISDGIGRDRDSEKERKVPY